MHRLAAGDTDAMRLCIEQFKGLVEFLARRYLRSAGADLESAVQDAFVELWRSAPLFDESRGSEATFVSMITRSSLRDSVREDLRRPPTAAHEELIQAPRSAAREHISSEDLATLRAAFDSLDEEDRQALRHAMHRGIPLQKLARCENVPLKTVQLNLRRAIAQMRAALREAEPLSDRSVA
ncbi:MAG: sigma-70 family RNA polymerase sigma factor [Phycisphaeraceae bacterium]|nr:sigma-70 family RNA polymerase sigma factor [Phycisphaeraceae bacterium]